MGLSSGRGDTELFSGDWEYCFDAAIRSRDDPEQIWNTAEFLVSQSVSLLYLFELCRKPAHPLSVPLKNLC